jgi:hypothetical protein
MEIIKEENLLVSIGKEGTNFEIDANSIDWIVESIIKLYSDPEKAVIRELMSNAKDATVERLIKEGKDPNEVREKSVILFDLKNGQMVVQDWGLGMSPNFMFSSYTRIGFSTRRNDKNAIGAYGMGRLSSLSISDFYTVETCYEGVKSVYLVERGNPPKVTLVSDEPTEEIGTKVIVPINNRLPWLSSVKSVLSSMNGAVFVISNYGTNRFEISTETVYEENNEKGKIRIFRNLINDEPAKTEGLRSEVEGLRFSLGGITYPIDFQKLAIEPITDNLFIDLELDCGISLPPPNRESLTYDERSVEILKGKIQKYLNWKERVQEEIYEKSDLIEKYQIVNDRIFNYPFKNDSIFMSKSSSLDTHKKELPLSSYYVSFIFKDANSGTSSGRHSENFLSSSELKDLTSRKGFKTFLKEYEKSTRTRIHLYSPKLTYSIFCGSSLSYSYGSFSDYEDFLIYLEENPDKKKVYQEFEKHIEELISCQMKKGGGYQDILTLFLNREKIEKPKPSNSYLQIKTFKTSNRSENIIYSPTNIPKGKSYIITDFESFSEEYQRKLIGGDVFFTKRLKPQQLDLLKSQKNLIILNLNSVSTNMELKEKGRSLFLQAMIETHLPFIEKDQFEDAVLLVDPSLLKDVLYLNTVSGVIMSDTLREVLCEIAEDNNLVNCPEFDRVFCKKDSLGILPYLKSPERQLFYYNLLEKARRIKLINNDIETD